MSSSLSFVLPTNILTHGPHYFSIDNNQLETLKAWVAFILVILELTMHTQAAEGQLGRKRMEKGHFWPSLDQPENRKTSPAAFLISICFTATYDLP